MTTRYNLTRDLSGYNGFGLAMSDLNYNTTLAASTAQNFDVPEDYQTWIAIFSYEPGSSVWVAVNDTAEVAGASFAVSNSQLNPTARLVQGGDNISCISEAADTQVCVQMYAIDPYK
jgi:hypothetical protein